MLKCTWATLPVVFLPLLSVGFLLRRGGGNGGKKGVFVFCFDTILGFLTLVTASWPQVMTFLSRL